MIKKKSLLSFDQIIAFNAASFSYAHESGHVEPRNNFFVKRRQSCVYRPYWWGQNNRYEYVGGPAQADEGMYYDGRYGYSQRY